MSRIRDIHPGIVGEKQLIRFPVPLRKAVMTVYDIRKRKRRFARSRPCIVLPTDKRRYHMQVVVGFAYAGNYGVIRVGRLVSGLVFIMVHVHYEIAEIGFR